MNAEMMLSDNFVRIGDVSFEMRPADIGWFPLFDVYCCFDIFFESNIIRDKAVISDGARIGLCDLDDEVGGSLLMIDHNHFRLRIRLPDCEGTDFEHNPLLIGWSDGEIAEMVRWLPLIPEYKNEIIRQLPVDRDEKKLLMVIS